MTSIYAILFTTCMLLSAAYLQNKPKPMDLNKYMWENRVLLLFTPDAQNEEYTKQKTNISTNAKGLPERDMVLIDIEGDDVLRVNGEVQTGENGKHLREQFSVAPDAFTILLLGKDGTEKYRSTNAVPVEDIYTIIDQMPMRQQEMRKQ
ncbi:DUF4174 domain-containing protein [Pontibacter cellulosilyticus]|uniref:DUF4174 domain-containing protein n=1 Tax=Pontibacter cellulosilyticus TaxID=1720253 RepID=A0A923N5S9_9BACT|nr:DUF4174 domain-containing protein [Pontibacter cellulosilyticus]MBC5992751.1 DUF4174 domain-containing protein [Pontibacter cellulosilyticus]